jgi:hypothetical protein
MVDGWPYITHNPHYIPIGATPRFTHDPSGDVDGLFFASSEDGAFSFNLDGSIRPGWPVVFDTMTFTENPVIVDIDHDGREELLARGDYRNSGGWGYITSDVFLFDDDGTVMPGFPIRHNRNRRFVVVDADMDGEYEIFYYSSHEGFLYCINRFGDPRPGWPVALPEDVVGHFGAAGDLDLDGTNEYVVNGLHHIYAFRYDGAMQPGFPITIEDDTYYYGFFTWGTVLGDFDSDGYLEISMAAGKASNDYSRLDSYVCVYENTGEIKDGWPIMYPETGIWQDPLPADINGDGQIELGFIAGGDGYFLDMDGNALEGWPAEVHPAYRDLVIVDIDGDGDSEIFYDHNRIFPDSLDSDSNWYWGYSYMYAYDHTGDLLPGYPLEVNGSHFMRPATFGYDETNYRLYMALYTDIALFRYNIDTGYVELYLFPDSTGPPDQWPMLCHDNLMTRNYSFVDNVTGVDDPGLPLPQTYILEQNYPNPFNSSTTVEFGLPKDELVNLTVYDIMGRVVSRPVEEELQAGYHSIAMTLPKAASSVYFYVLETDKTCISRRMILLK